MITIQTGKESFKHSQGKQLQICECWTCRNFEGENKWCGRKGIEVNYDTVKADCEYFDKKEYCGDCKFFEQQWIQEKTTSEQHNRRIFYILCKRCTG